MKSKQINKEEIGKRLKQLRLSSGLTFEQVSKDTDVSLDQMYQYEGGYRLPNAYSLYVLSLYYDVDYAYILGLSNISNVKKMINIGESEFDINDYSEDDQWWTDKIKMCEPLIKETIKLLLGYDTDRLIKTNASITKSDDTDFSIRLQQLRKEKNITAKQLSELTGIGFSTIKQYEGKFRSPSLDNLYVLSQFFNVPIEYLAGFSDDKEVYQLDSTKIPTDYSDLELLFIQHFSKANKETKLIVANLITLSESIQRNGHNEDKNLEDILSIIKTLKV